MIRTLIHNRFTCLLLLTVGFIAPNVAFGNGLALTLLNYTVQTQGGTVDIGRTVTINAIIKNTDTLNGFSGTLDFGLRNSQQELSTSGLFRKPAYSTRTITLEPGESVPAIFSVDVEGPYFKPGPDVVVVWPISTAPAQDSIVIVLDIQGPADLKNDIDDDEALPFAYTVQTDRIILLNLAPETNFKQVRIYTISGQQVNNITGTTVTEIPIGYLPKGIYLCEMLFTDNSRRVIRFAH